MRVVGELMEIWLRLAPGDTPSSEEHVDRYLFPQPTPDHLHLASGTLFGPEGTVGAHVHIVDGATQANGIELIGSVDWILVECETWSMIPLENLIAARSGSPTKIAAVITSPMQAQGAGFALQEGVDALVMDRNPALLEAAKVVKSLRFEQETPSEVSVQQGEDLTIANLTVKSIEEAGVGDRYCLDFLSLFHQNEGVLVGSSASTLLLVHSETVPSTFVPTRPFRVNAGAPHAYIMMGDGSTKYLAELNAGDAVRAVTSTGESRNVVLGRLKIEQRPLLKVTVSTEPNNERKPQMSHVFLQQAETVRLMANLNTTLSITDIAAGDSVLGWCGRGGRHLGKVIGSRVEER
jgi:3-dehydroquinate synthase II